MTALAADEDDRELGGWFVPQVAEVFERLPVEPLDLVDEEGCGGWLRLRRCCDSSALPDPEIGRVRALGVDDFTLKRGHNYGTILIDMDSRRPLDVLPERSVDALAD
ncbi:hypothetical protein [Streptomyces chartreusis]|uniref:hypothetical protein n=1 Tax=Streptomyces chartreusis TaxID=1969 RepID=UPI0036AFF325